MNNGLSLGEICEAVVDCEHKTAPTSPLGQHPSIRTTNIKNGRIDFDGANRVDEPTYRAWTRRRVPQAGDLILSREAPVGEVGIIPQNQLPCLGQRTVLLAPDREKTEPRYLLYLLLTPWIQHEMLRQAGGSTVDHLNMSDIRGLRLPEVPPLPEQRAIARILGALDDKIELNRETNRTLEATAQAIFKSWFVDFDPVTAKAAGQEPFGMDADTAALFPTRFIESELGPIPEGWEVERIESFLSMARTSVKPLEHPDELFAHFSIPAYDNGQAPVLEAGSAIKSNKYLISNGVVLLSKLNPEIRRVWLPSEYGETRQICSTEFLVCSPLTPISIEYLYCLFSNGDFRAEFAGLVTGTSNSHQRVPPKDFMRMKLVRPKDEVAVAFSSFVAQLLKRALLNRLESLSLADLRDTLLPKLLSGEIRVSHAEKELERAAEGVS